MRIVATRRFILVVVTVAVSLVAAELAFSQRPGGGMSGPPTTQPARLTPSRELQLFAQAVQLTDMFAAGFGVQFRDEYEVFIFVMLIYQGLYTQEAQRLAATPGG